eukprot:scaffold30826_cov67-Phaeocystis_antarctica.AAC.8
MSFSTKFEISGASAAAFAAGFMPLITGLSGKVCLKGDLRRKTSKSTMHARIISKAAMIGSNARHHPPPSPSPDATCNFGC